MNARTPPIRAPLVLPRGTAASLRRPASGARSSAAICDRAHVSAGVGSNVTQPQSSNHASTHECASVSRTIHAALLFE